MECFAPLRVEIHPAAGSGHGSRKNRHECAVFVPSLKLNRPRVSSKSKRTIPTDDE